MTDQQSLPVAHWPVPIDTSNMTLSQAAQAYQAAHKAAQASQVNPGIAPTGMHHMAPVPGGLPSPQVFAGAQNPLPLPPQPAQQAVPPHHYTNPGVAPNSMGTRPTFPGHGMQPPLPTPPVQQQPHPVYADPHTSYGQVGGIYDPSKFEMRGFIQDPHSPTGWSFINQYGQLAQGVTKPHGAERVISRQQILAADPGFYSQGYHAGASTASPSTTFDGPWAQGFNIANSSWKPEVMTDGKVGYVNVADGRTWSPGEPIPTGQPQAQAGGGDFYTQLLNNLINSITSL